MRHSRTLIGMVACCGLGASVLAATAGEISKSAIRTAEGLDMVGRATTPAAAIQDLAERLGISADRIEVIEQREVTWPDASVGCPLPGMSYAQVLTNGSLIRLEADEKIYEYHSGGQRRVFYCANPQDPLPPDAERHGPT